MSFIALCFLFAHTSHWLSDANYYPLDFREVQGKADPFGSYSDQVEVWNDKRDRRLATVSTRPLLESWLRDQSAWGGPQQAQRLRTLLSKGYLHTRLIWRIESNRGAVIQLGLIDTSESSRLVADLAVAVAVEQPAKWKLLSTSPANRSPYDRSTIIGADRGSAFLVRERQLYRLEDGPFSMVPAYSLPRPPRGHGWIIASLHAQKCILRTDGLVLERSSSVVVDLSSNQITTSDPSRFFYGKGATQPSRAHWEERDRANLASSTYRPHMVWRLHTEFAFNLFATGNYIVSAGETTKVISPKTGQILLDLPKSSDVKCFGNALILLLDRSGEVQVWDILSRRMRYRLKKPCSAISAPMSDMFYVWNDEIQQIELSSGRVKQSTQPFVFSWGSPQVYNFVVSPYRVYFNWEGHGISALDSRDLAHGQDYYCDCYPVGMVQNGKAVLCAAVLVSGLGLLSADGKKFASISDGYRCGKGDVQLSDDGVALTAGYAFSYNGNDLNLFGHYLLAIDTNTGKLLWRHPTIWIRTVAFGPNVFTLEPIEGDAFYEQKASIRDLHTGKLLWRSKVPSGQISFAAAGGVMCLLRDGELIGFR